MVVSTGSDASGCAASLQPPIKSAVEIAQAEMLLPLTTTSGSFHIGAFAGKRSEPACCKTSRFGSFQALVLEAADTEIADVLGVCPECDDLVPAEVTGDS